MNIRLIPVDYAQHLPTFDMSCCSCSVIFVFLAHGLRQAFGLERWCADGVLYARLKITITISVLEMINLSFWVGMGGNLIRSVAIGPNQTAIAIQASKPVLADSLALLWQLKVEVWVWDRRGTPHFDDRFEHSFCRRVPVVWWLCLKQTLECKASEHNGGSFILYNLIL